MEHIPEIELTDVRGIGENLAEHFRDAGFETANDVAEAAVHEVKEVHTVGPRRAEEIIANANQHIEEESFVDRQWDPYTKQYYDAGVDIFECEECGREYGNRAVYLTHTRNCDRW